MPIVIKDAMFTSQLVDRDGGLMPAPKSTRTMRLGMAERYEVVIDVAKGTQVVLQNLGLPNNTDLDTTGAIMAFDVVADPSEADDPIPDVLDPHNEVMQLQPSQAKRASHGLRP